ncbi:MAG: hypothetical protein AAGJ94_16615 [Pseudomonadota bacterium]
MAVLHVYDFDGVLADSLDDLIYRLPALEEEEVVLAKLSNALSWDLDGMDQSSQRILLFQAAATILNIPIEPGPLLEHCRASAGMTPWFVLTARTGWHGTGRVRAFLEMHDLQPLEIFSVGRVRKNDQLLHLHEEFPNHRIVYFKDSRRHLSDASSLEIANIEVVPVDRKEAPQDAEALYAYTRDVMERAIGAISEG